MSDPVVRFAVLALSLEEARALQGTTGDADLEVLLNDAIDRGHYGEHPDHWRPFGGDTIEELMKLEGVQFTSSTQALSGSPANIGKAGIDVFFVDLLATLEEGKRTFVAAIDLFLSDGDKGVCCFLGFPEAEGGIATKLDVNYRTHWAATAGTYPEGAPHRIALRADDVQNIRASLAHEARHRPNSRTADLLEKKYPPKEEPF